MSAAQKNKKNIWNPYFYRSFPGFASILGLWEKVAASEQDWPSIHGFNQLRELSAQCSVVFIEQESTHVYESKIFNTRQVPTRLGSWHDFFNNLTWLTFPRIKWAMIARSMQENATKSPDKIHLRTALQNRLAHLDECGIVICTSEDTVIEMVQQRLWQQLFWETDRLTEISEPLIIGHGLLEKGLNPYIGMTGKVLFVKVASDFFALSMQEKTAIIDRKISNFILSADFNTSFKLHPFPLLGWPHWHPDNRQVAFYQNTDYFRTTPFG